MEQKISGKKYLLVSHSNQLKPEMVCFNKASPYASTHNFYAESSMILVCTKKDG